VLGSKAEAVMEKNNPIISVFSYLNPHLTYQTWSFAAVSQQTRFYSLAESEITSFEEVTISPNNKSELLNAFILHWCERETLQHSEYAYYLG